MRKKKRKKRPNKHGTLENGPSEEDLMSMSQFFFAMPNEGGLGATGKYFLVRTKSRFGVIQTGFFG